MEVGVEGVGVCGDIFPHDTFMEAGWNKGVGGRPGKHLPSSRLAPRLAWNSSSEPLPASP
eukprot:755208-Hanusia_phi.AAC.2